MTRKFLRFDAPAKNFRKILKEVAWTVPEYTYRK